MSIDPEVVELTADVRSCTISLSNPPPWPRFNQKKKKREKCAAKKKNKDIEQHQYVGIPTILGWHSDHSGFCTRRAPPRSEVVLAKMCLSYTTAYRSTQSPTSIDAPEAKNSFFFSQNKKYLLAPNAQRDRTQRRVRYLVPPGGGIHRFAFLWRSTMYQVLI